MTELCVMCFRCDLARADERKKLKEEGDCYDHAPNISLDCTHYWQGVSDERETVLGIISERITDLRTCGKADDCESQAHGVELALADLRDAWGLS